MLQCHSVLTFHSLCIIQSPNPISSTTEKESAFLDFSLRQAYHINSIINKNTIWEENNGRL